jgi:diguanylate cyclase (GGDEF)-like protein/PAS domain S-box-containing protein
MYIRDHIELGADEEYLERLTLLERYILLSLSYDTVAVINIDGMFEEANQVWEKVSGYTSQELIGSYLLEYMHFDDREKSLAELQKLITSDIETRTFNFRFLCKNGAYKRLNWNVVFSPEHNLYYCVVKDVDEEVSQAAYRDVLTGLPNRLYLTDHFDGLLNLIPCENCFAAVMFLDLDGFKQINDQYGHKTGDMLLSKVAKRLSKCAPSDLVCRLGGDEFVVVLSGIRAKSAPERVAVRIQDSLSKPFTLGEHQVSIGVSIGISLAPKEGMDMDGLLEKADMAMYQVKRSGKNGFLFSESLKNNNFCSGIASDTGLASN